MFITRTDTGLKYRISAVRDGLNLNDRYRSLCFAGLAGELRHRFSAVGMLILLNEVTRYQLTFNDDFCIRDCPVVYSNALIFELFTFPLNQHPVVAKSTKSLHQLNCAQLICLRPLLMCRYMPIKSLNVTMPHTTITCRNITQ